MTTTRITGPDGLQYDVTYTLTPAKLTLASVTPVVAPVPVPSPSVTLTPSGSITVTANNQVIENKLVAGQISVNGRIGVIIRNCTGWFDHGLDGLGQAGLYPARSNP